MSLAQRCHAHILEVRRRMVVVIRMKIDFVRRVGFDHRVLEVDLVRRAPEVDSDRMGVEADRMTEVEAGHRTEIGVDHKVRVSVVGMLDSDRTGSDHTAVAVQEAEVAAVDYSPAVMIADIAGRRAQGKNNRREVATGRASWQRVVAVGAGPRLPGKEGLGQRRQGSLDIQT
jgi:hypothetical protein